MGIQIKKNLSKFLKKTLDNTFNSYSLMQQLDYSLLALRDIKDIDNGLSSRELYNFIETFLYNNLLDLNCKSTISKICLIEIVDSIRYIRTQTQIRWYIDNFYKTKY